MRSFLDNDGPRDLIAEWHTRDWGLDLSPLEVLHEDMELSSSRRGPHHPGQPLTDCRGVSSPGRAASTPDGAATPLQEQS